MTNDEKLNILERNAKSPLPGQEQEAETLLWLIALARIGAAVQPMETALKKAIQLAEIAGDWNLDEVEIDGIMVSTLSLKTEFQSALPVKP